MPEMMNAGAINTFEFPFLAEMPKREKSKLQILWDNFEEARAVVKVKGLLVPPVMAATLLGVSRQRVDELMRDGKLERVQLNGKWQVTEASLLEWARAEHKAGRPFAHLQDVGGCVKTAMRVGRDAMSERRNGRK